MAKGETAHYEQTLFLSQCFKYSSAAKCVYMWERVNKKTHLKWRIIIICLFWFCLEQGENDDEVDDDVISKRLHQDQVRSSPTALLILIH